jgi:hypothetical protein
VSAIGSSLKPSTEQQNHESARESVASVSVYQSTSKSTALPRLPARPLAVLARERGVHSPPLAQPSPPAVLAATAGSCAAATCDGGARRIGAPVLAQPCARHALTPGRDLPAHPFSKFSTLPFL